MVFEVGNRTQCAGTVPPPLAGPGTCDGARPTAAACKAVLFLLMPQPPNFISGHRQDGVTADMLL
jgi:hypothetical protein